jgi:3'(2'), 5'-bisphosphate nucleotidase
LYFVSRKRDALSHLLMDIKQLFNLALEAICHANDKVLEIYQTSHYQISYKSDKSPVTKADMASSDLICKVLDQSGIPVVCEETTEIPYQKRKSLPYFWLVDPLDGTKEFISRNGEFTVNIALIENNRPILGLIAIPTQNLLYFGGKNLPPFKLNLSIRKSFDYDIEVLHGEPLSVSKKKNPVRVVVSRSHLDDKTKTYLAELQKKFRSVKIVSAGSSLKFCRIAEGEAEIYLRFSPTMEWDTAAGQAIAEASGACMVSLPEYGVFLYNKPVLRNGGFLLTSLENIPDPDGLKVL